MYVRRWFPPNPPIFGKHLIIMLSEEDRPGGGESEWPENTKTLGSGRKLSTLNVCWGDENDNGFHPLQMF